MSSIERNDSNSQATWVHADRSGYRPRRKSPGEWRRIEAPGRTRGPVDEGAFGKRATSWGSLVPIREKTSSPVVTKLNETRVPELSRANGITKDCRAGYSEMTLMIRNGALFNGGPFH